MDKTTLPRSTEVAREFILELLQEMEEQKKINQKLSERCAYLEDECGKLVAEGRHCFNLLAKQKEGE